MHVHVRKSLMLTEKAEAGNGPVVGQADTGEEPVELRAAALDAYRVSRIIPYLPILHPWASPNPSFMLGF